MLKKIVTWLSKKPKIFNFLRRIIEFNFVSIKKTIIKEFSLKEEEDKKTFEKNAQKKILDVPCGTGEFCMLFDPCSYIGIDISQKYIDYAKRTYKRTFYCRDARDNNFKDSSFDSVLVIGFLHHLDKPSIADVLKEIKRVLKQDGKMLLIEDSPINSKWNIIGKLLQKYDAGINIRFPNEYRRILEKDFLIKKFYQIQSGFWTYSVFNLVPK